MDATIPALRQTPDGWLIDLWLDDLHVTAGPLTDHQAQEFARLLWDSFGVEIDGDAPWM